MTDYYDKTSTKQLERRKTILYAENEKNIGRAGTIKVDSLTLP